MSDFLNAAFVVKKEAVFDGDGKPPQTDFGDDFHNLFDGLVDGESSRRGDTSPPGQEPVMSDGVTEASGSQPSGGANSLMVLIGAMQVRMPGVEGAATATGAPSAGEQGAPPHGPASVDDGEPLLGASRTQGPHAVATGAAITVGSALLIASDPASGASLKTALENKSNPVAADVEVETPAIKVLRVETHFKPVIDGLIEKIELTPQRSPTADGRPASMLGSLLDAVPPATRSATVGTNGSPFAANARPNAETIGAGSTQVNSSVASPVGLPAPERRAVAPGHTSSQLANARGSEPLQGGMLADGVELVAPVEPGAAGATKDVARVDDRTRATVLGSGNEHLDFEATESKISGDLSQGVSASDQTRVLAAKLVAAVSQPDTPGSHLTRAEVVAAPAFAVAARASEAALRHVSLQLHPADLGLVNVTIKLDGDALELKVVVETEAAARLMAQERDQLCANLRASGYKPEVVTIQIRGMTASDEGFQSASRSGEHGAPADEQGSGQRGNSDDRRHGSDQSGRTFTNHRQDEEEHSSRISGGIYF